MIVELLEKGEQNATPAKDLAKILNIEVRDVMHIIRGERLTGEPICSNNKGYYIAADNNDLEGTIKRLYKQGKETIRVAETMRKYHEQGAKNGN